MSHEPPTDDAEAIEMALGKLADLYERMNGTRPVILHGELPRNVLVQWMPIVADYVVCVERVRAEKIEEEEQARRYEASAREALTEAQNARDAALATLRAATTLMGNLQATPRPDPVADGPSRTGVLMATLNGVVFENPLYVGDGSFGDPVTGPYARELQQQRFLPPPGDYWLSLPSLGWWEPAVVRGGHSLSDFSLIGLHSGETRLWDLTTAAWQTRHPHLGEAVRPITPETVRDQHTSLIPEEVIEAFNEMIAEEWNGHSAKVKQDAVMARILLKLATNEEYRDVTRDQVFTRRWLDVEDTFRHAGWEVEYDKPAYNETYTATFTFSACP